MKLKIGVLFSFLILFPENTYAAVNLADNYAFGSVKSLGQLIGYLVPLGLTLGGIMVSIYILLGAFDLIISWGDKNAIASARNKILHGIVGLVLLIAMFVVLKFLPTALGLNPGFSIIGM